MQFITCESFFFFYFSLNQTATQSSTFTCRRSAKTCGEHLHSIVFLVLAKAFAYAGFKRRSDHADHPIGGGMTHVDTGLP